MADPHLLPDSNFRRDRLGVVDITLSYAIQGPAADSAPEPYDQLLSFKPEAPLGLVEVGRSSRKQQDGDWLLEIAFAGLPPGDEGGSVLDYDNSSVDSPIETFSKFNLIASLYRAKFDQDKQFRGFDRYFKADTADGPGPLLDTRERNPFYGTTHFLESNPVLYVVSAVRSLPENSVRNLCKIVEPEIPKGTDNVFVSPDGKTWLKKSFRAQQRGNCWETRTEYWLGKWAPHIYQQNSGYE